MVDACIMQPPQEQFTNNNLYTSSIQNGVVETFYPDGMPKSGEEYINGKLEGLRVELHSNGKIAVWERYKNGKRQGHRTVHDYSTGNVLVDEYYSQGKLCRKRFTFTSQGRLMTEADYDEGKLDGALKIYDKDENVVCITQHRMGQLVDNKIAVSRKQAVIPKTELAKQKKLNTDVLRPSIFQL